MEALLVLVISDFSLIKWLHLKPTPLLPEQHKEAWPSPQWFLWCLVLGHWQRGFGVLLVLDLSIHIHRKPEQTKANAGVGDLTTTIYSFKLHENTSQNNRKFTPEVLQLTASAAAVCSC